MSTREERERLVLMQGTLDVRGRKTFSWGPRHGYAVARWIAQTTDDALRVEDAKVSIAGSGDGAFASDGRVNASIVGSGEVRVIGRATCKVSSVGSGRLVCQPE